MSSKLIGITVYAHRLGPVDDGCATYRLYLGVTVHGGGVQHERGGATVHFDVCQDGCWLDPCPLVEETAKRIASKLAAARLPVAHTFEI